MLSLDTVINTISKVYNKSKSYVEYKANEMYEKRKDNTFMNKANYLKAFEDGRAFMLEEINREFKGMNKKEPERFSFRDVRK